jgi:TatD DNase family protein
MFNFIDSHAHIYLEEFDSDIDAVIRRSQAVGVNKVYMPNIDPGTVARMNSLAAGYPEFCYPMMGLHPCSVDENFENNLTLIESNLRSKKYFGVGEIGTDLYWEKKFREQQKIAFQFQLKLAKEMKLPAIIHCRESLEETIGMVEQMKDENLNGVFHCFTGSIEQANRISALGFYLGIGGVITFKNGGLDRIIPNIDLSGIILETDSPYLAPVPYRGKRNEPSFISLIAERISNICGISIEEVSRVTTKNSQALFGT